MRNSPIPAIFVALISLSLPACQMHDEEEAHQEQHEIVVTTPKIEEVTITQPFVCQIHSRNHIEVCSLMQGYLEEILVKEGQQVNKDDVLFKVIPRSYKAKIAAAQAEVAFAEVRLENTIKLNKEGVVSIQQVRLEQAKLGEAKGKLQEVEADLYFSEVRAQFDGIIDRQMRQRGSLVKEGDVLTTLSDNKVMWVYFNVPEANYLAYKRGGARSLGSSQYELLDSQIELKLADGSIFNQTAGNVVTIEGMFNNRTGNIQFRADFPNSQGLLRHGQTGTVLIRHKVKNALVIPQRATFEFLDKRYVWVIGEDHVVHQRLITLKHELEDIFVIKSGLEVKDKIVLEGVRQLREKDKVEEYEFRKPEEALAHQKNRAE